MAPLVPRFNRSASCIADAVESPLPGDDLLQTSHSKQVPHAPTHQSGMRSYMNQVQRLNNFEKVMAEQLEFQDEPFYSEDETELTEDTPYELHHCTKDFDEQSETYGLSQSKPGQEELKQPHDFGFSPEDPVSATKQQLPKRRPPLDGKSKSTSLDHDIDELLDRDFVANQSQDSSRAWFDRKRQEVLSRENTIDSSRSIGGDNVTSYDMQDDLDVSVDSVSRIEPFNVSNAFSPAMSGTSPNLERLRDYSLASTATASPNTVVPASAKLHSDVQPSVAGKNRDDHSVRSNGSRTVDTIPKHALAVRAPPRSTDCIDLVPLSSTAKSLRRSSGDVTTIHSASLNDPDSGVLTPVSAFFSAPFSSATVKSADAGSDMKSNQSDLQPQLAIANSIPFSSGKISSIQPVDRRQPDTGSSNSNETLAAVQTNAPVAVNKLASTSSAISRSDSGSNASCGVGYSADVSSMSSSFRLNNSTSGKTARLPLKKLVHKPSFEPSSSPSTASPMPRKLNVPVTPVRDNAAASAADAEMLSEVSIVLEPADEAYIAQTAIAKDEQHSPLPSESSPLNASAISLEAYEDVCSVTIVEEAESPEHTPSTPLAGDYSGNQQGTDAAEDASSSSCIAKLPTIDEGAAFLDDDVAAALEHAGSAETATADNRDWTDKPTPSGSCDLRAGSFSSNHSAKSVESTRSIDTLNGKVFLGTSRSYRFSLDDSLPSDMWLPTDRDSERLDVLSTIEDTPADYESSAADSGISPRSNPNQQRTPEVTPCSDFGSPIEQTDLRQELQDLDEDGISSIGAADVDDDMLGSQAAGQAFDAYDSEDDDCEFPFVGRRSDGEQSSDESRRHLLHSGDKQLSELLLAGDAEAARALINAQPPTLLKGEAHKLLVMCVKASEQLQQPLRTIELIIRRLGVDLDAVDSAGLTVLHYALANSREISELLVRSGCSILVDDSAGNCALSLSLQHRLEWLLELFVRSGREEQFFRSASQYRKFKYVTCLIFAGYSDAARNAIRRSGVLVTSVDATELLKICSGNFEQMRDPVETFELLESLGASV